MNVGKPIVKHGFAEPWQVDLPRDFRLNLPNKPPIESFSVGTPTPAANRGGLLTNAPMQYRNNPEQAISCEDREGNGKCGALWRATTPCRLARTGAESSQACRSQADGAFTPLRVGMFRLQPYGVEFPFLPAVQKYPNNTAISGGTPQRRSPWYDSPGSLATETGQWSEALPLNSGETAEKEHTLAGCPSDRVLTKALGEQSPGTAEKINRTLSGNSLLLTAEYLDVCTGTRAFCRDFASEGF